MVLAFKNRRGEKMVKRCDWVPDDTLYRKYHDEGWGMPVYDDRLLFEMLCLEGAQAGLSWITILRKREHYKDAFDNFNAEKIVTYDEVKIAELLNNKGIVRNKLKVQSVVTNAKAFLKIQQEHGSFSSYLWNLVGGKPIVNHFEKVSEMPASTALSDAVSKQLKKDGFKFIGSTICYAFMQAVGMVNDHTTNCYCYKK